LQVSWAEHSLGPSPQVAAVLGLYPTEFRVGSQTRQALPGCVVPAATQLPPMLQPAHGLHPGVPGTQELEPASALEFSVSDAAASGADEAASGVVEFAGGVVTPPST
jgi:hypothetical protein